MGQGNFAEAGFQHTPHDSQSSNSNYPFLGDHGVPGLLLSILLAFSPFHLRRMICRYVLLLLLCYYL